MIRLENWIKYTVQKFLRHCTRPVRRAAAVCGGVGVVVAGVVLAAFVVVGSFGAEVITS